MTWESAKPKVRGTKYAKREVWETGSFVASVRGTITLHVIGSPAGEYHPTAADRAATDWIVYGR